jgi:CheY-like chemotaxis protein
MASPRLLLADDSVTIQRVIELTFAEENVDVVAVGDGREAIERIQSSPPDIVLADVGMPERDGYEVAEFVKRDPRLAHIPVLLLTGAFEPVDEARAREIGCEGVLVKPFEPQMVISRVRELLKGAGPQVAAAAVVESSRAAVPASAVEPAVPVQGETRSGEALENYFDRLDAALAHLGGTTAPPVLEADRPAPSGSAAPPGATAARPSAAPQSASGGTGIRAGGGAAPVASAAVAAPPPQAPAVQSGGHAPALHAAFAALLAAERGEPPGVPLPVPEPLSEETMEEIVRRVVARMGDEKMRTLVLDTAERLVREEIERIKKQ